VGGGDPEHVVPALAGIESVLEQIANFDNTTFLNARPRKTKGKINVHEYGHRLAPIRKMKTRGGTVLWDGRVEAVAKSFTHGISLRRGVRYVIIDAKYYQSTLSHYYDATKVHSGNLYQLMSYLTNAKRRDGEDLSGMLIYPRVDRTLRERYTIQGYPVAVCTVDLNQDWQDVRDELFSIVQ
jgi:hypothetical protein